MKISVAITGFAILTSTSSSPGELDRRNPGPEVIAIGSDINSMLEANFAAQGRRTLHISAGSYIVPCGTSLTAKGSLSLIGAGIDRTIIRLPPGCRISHPLMSWISKSNVRLSGMTIDLKSPRFDSRQDVLQFAAFDGDARNLRVDHLRIMGGTAPSLVIAVAAAGGFEYSGVRVDHNVINVAPSPSQNQCIALSTVNGIGKISFPQIIDNVCHGSGIQADGYGAAVIGNDISQYQFGTGIFIAFVTRTKIIAAEWANGVATLHYEKTPNAFVRGETIYVWDVKASRFNGAFRVTAVGPTSISYQLPRDPGLYSGGGAIAPGPSGRRCAIRNNIMHNTPQRLDVNGTAPGGIENNCVNSIVEGNRAINLGGAGYVNFASGAVYTSNKAIGVGFLGRASAGGEADAAAFAIFDNGSGMPWYRSAGLIFRGNVSNPTRGRPRFGYFEEPWNYFGATLRGNIFKAASQSTVVRKANRL